VRHTKQRKLQHAGDEPDLIARICALGESKVGLVETIVDGLHETEGEDLARSITALLKDPRLASLLELAMRVRSDDLDQLLFAAEDYYSELVLGCR